MNSRNNKTNSVTRMTNMSVLRIVVILLLFMFIYKFSIPGLPPQLTSRRLASILLFVFSLFTRGTTIHLGKNKESIFGKIYIGFLIITIYLIIIGFFVGKGSGIRAIESFFDFLLFMPLAFYGMASIFQSKYEFMRILKDVSLLQAFFVILCIFDNNARVFIGKTFYLNSYWTNIFSLEVLFRGGYSFGVGCITSTGSLQIGLGLISVMYLLLKGNDSKLSLIIEYIIISFACISLARTGFVISILCLLTILTYKDVFISYIKKIIIFFIVFVSLFMIMRIESVSGLLQKIFSRLINTTKNGGINSFFNSYFHADSTVIPQISLATFFGTGTISGMSGNGIYVNADGGFLKNYVGLGILGSLYLYITVFSNIINKARKFVSKVDIRTTMVCILYLIIGEFKEYFIVGCTIVIILSFIDLKNDRLNDEELISIR